MWTYQLVILLFLLVFLYICVCPLVCVIHQESLSSLSFSWVENIPPVLKCLAPQEKPGTNSYAALLDLYICFMY